MARNQNYNDEVMRVPSLAIATIRDVQAPLWDTATAITGRQLESQSNSTLLVGRTANSQ